MKKGVHISESSFNGFYNLAVEFHKHGLYAFQLGLQPIIHIFTPEYFESVMTSTKHIQKANAYNVVIPWLGTGLVVSTGEKWHKDRKLLTPAFHFKILDQFNPSINKHALILCDKISSTLNYQMTDCVSVLASFALDIICETSMGVDMKTQTVGENKFSSSFTEFTKLAVKRVLTVYNNNDFLYNLTPDGQKAKLMIKNMHEFTEKIVAQRKKEIMEMSAPDDSGTKKKRRSLLDLMLDIHLNGGDFSIKEIQFQLDNFAFAGQDTVSNALAFVMLCLANYSDVQQRVREEMNECVGDDVTELTSEHLARLCYLDMVIKESLRLYPPGPFTGRQLLEDAQIGDYIIPKGTDIWMNYYALHRNPDIWTEPEKFDPERFSPENSIDRHPFAFVPFGGGLRNCIGQRYARAAIKIVIVQIMKRFQILPATKIDEITLCFEMTMKTMEPIQIKFRPIDGRVKEMYKY
ncbi:Cytochrome P450 4c3 [Pseudolycoriella hygida]|uniref:Cytochrome P450 4c3 n=1 Tax=Pseudolycoriella hygida TaxID=35572 RepID=A0A9Q0S5F3_9DIPT|nr:Cytochrome P450 4c3 [Pseudolycoriella hygida]